MDKKRKFRIFRKDYPSQNGGTFSKYSTTISRNFKKKDENGNEVDDWQNKWIDVEFHIKGGVDLQNGTDIELDGNQMNISFKHAKHKNKDTGEEYWSDDVILVIYEGFQVVGVSQQQPQQQPYPQQYPPQGYPYPPQGYPYPPMPPGYPPYPPQYPPQPAMDDIPDSFKAAEDDIPF